MAFFDGAVVDCFHRFIMATEADRFSDEFFDVCIHAADFDDAAERSDITRQDLLRYWENRHFRIYG